jgi:hypothetical protein
MKKGRADKGKDEKRRQEIRKVLILTLTKITYKILKNVIAEISS